MRIKSIKINHFDTPKPYYDVVNAYPYNNFLIKTDSKYIVSHNCFFDEISFIALKDVEKQKAMAIDMIDTATGGMQTRFAKNGQDPTLLILASSKRSEKSFLEDHMRKQLDVKGYDAFIVDEAIWNVWPSSKFKPERFKVALGNKWLASEIIPEGADETTYIRKGHRILNIPMDLYVRFASNIDRALCDYAGISSSELQKYISGARIDEAIVDEYKNPFREEILEIGNDMKDNQQYYDYFDLSRVPRKLKSKPLYIHLDMSVSGDFTGIAGTWIVGKQLIPNSESRAYELRYQLAFAVSIKAPKGSQISFAKNKDFIYWLRHQGFNIQGISSDTYQSTPVAQDLIAAGFNYKIISVDRLTSLHKGEKNIGETTTGVCEPYLFLKNAIYDRRVLLFEQKELIQELTDLEMNGSTGKIDHPENGTVGRKDVADAFCGSLWHAQQHADEYIYNYSEDDLDVLKSLKYGSGSSYDEINEEFEKQLKDIYVNKPLEQIEKEAKDKALKDEEERVRMLWNVHNGELVW